jgi:hypothetical protein
MFHLSIVGYRDERLIAACKLNWPLVIKWIAAVMLKKKHSHRFQVFRCMIKGCVADVEVEASRTGRPEAPQASLVRARSLDVTRLLALVADALTGCLRRTISREMTDFTA